MKEKIKGFIRRECSAWKPWEIVWLGIATAVILALSIYWKDSLVGILSALTGIWCVILTGKGKLSGFIFGIINVLLYSWLAFGAKYYGDVMLNLLYFLPMCFIGLAAWRRSMNGETNEVIKKKLKPKTALLIFTAAGAAVAGYGLVLKRLGGNLPFVDSCSTVLSVAAQILCNKRYAEQWILWIVVDVVTVIMWIFAFFNGGESVATLMMWSVYLINAVIMYIRWKREAENVVSV